MYMILSFYAFDNTSVVNLKDKCCCIVLLFYVHGKHLRSCRDGQLT